MAFNDTLFQLGMDLTRSSTAQKEDRARVEFFAQETDRDTYPAEHNVKTAGTTIFIDLHGASRLGDVKSAERALKRAVEGMGLKLKSLHFDNVASGGVSGVAVLSSGHVSVQACSRSQFAAIDARGCLGLKPETALVALANAFEAREAVIRKVRTADPMAVPTLRIVPQSKGRSVKPKAEAKAA